MRKILLVIIIINFCKVLNAQTWFNLETGTLSNNAIVRALANYNSDIYAGGYFTEMGGDICNNIAKWDGTTWSALGAGMNSDVRALVVYNGELYAGGQFSTAGGIVANWIAKWNGTTWTSVGGGMGDCSTCLAGQGVQSMAVYNGELYVAGAFTMAGSTTVKNIAKWNGTSWSAVGTGITNGGTYTNVLALAAYNGELYAGGFFSTAGGVSVGNLAKWNGSSWSTVGCSSGANNFVYAFSDHNTNFYTGGDFGYVCSASRLNIDKWNGTSHSSVGSGTSGGVYALGVYNGNLYAGGGFTNIGGISASHIARWNGGSWSALGSGVGGIVYAITSDNLSLYVGGTFLTAGGITVNRVARWIEGSVGVNEINSKHIVSIAPNPFTFQTTINFSQEQKHTTVKIIDALGKEVKTINFTGNELILEKGMMSEGMYFVQIIDDNNNVVNRKIIIQ